MDTLTNEKLEEKTVITGSGFDFSDIEKKLLDEDALKKTTWQDLLKEYEPWIVREYAANARECTPQQRAQWEKAINLCHQKILRKTRIFTLLFAVLAIAIFAESLLVKELTFPIRILMLVLGVYCSVNCWSHWLLNRKYSQVEEL